MGVLADADAAFNHIGWKFYLVFICLDICTFTLVFLVFPETKGLSLEEMNVLFGDDVAVKLVDARTDAGPLQHNKGADAGAPVEMAEKA